MKNICRVAVVFSALAVIFAYIPAATFASIAFSQTNASPAPPTVPTGNLMAHHAHGTFTVKMQPLTPAPADGLSRFSIDKQMHGDLEATTKGEMFSAGDPQLGEAGYVAIEVVTGTLNGKGGSFALQQMATMDKSGYNLSVIVAPGSGTGALKGIAGKFVIKIVDGQHFYDLDYTLPA